MLAELHGMGARARVTFALGILLRCAALRRAVVGRRGAAIEFVVPVHRPLRCTLRVHRWRYDVNPDGCAFLRCTRCGDDKGDSFVPDAVSLPGNISLGISTTWN